MSGVDFLNKLYKDLHLSEIVQNTASGSVNKNESVERYMARLTSTHDKAASSEYGIELLKQLYYNKYVIKEKDIPKYMDKNKIINAQKDSLANWLDYFLDENVNYPMWAKYWVFQGILKIGTYDEANEIFFKRSKKTLAPFIEVNPEIIAKCIDLVVEHIGKKELNDNHLKQLVESGNFSKLYTFFLKQKKEIILNTNNLNDGVWITYHYETLKEAETKKCNGIEPEYLKLYNSLQGYDTGWCTAGSKEVAKEQICGSNNGYKGGNFYVYYSKDNNNEYKIPRLAIRMNGEDVGEIRGIYDGQNVEDGLEGIVEEKLNTLKGISKEKKDHYLEIINNMKYLTLLYKKSVREDYFIEKDIKFIYQLDKPIKSFGYREDPRIEKIISKRNRRDDFKLLTQKNDIAKLFLKNIEDIPEFYKKNKDFMLGFNKVWKESTKSMYLFNGNEILKYVDSSLQKDKEFVLDVIKLDASAFEYADSGLKKDKEFVLDVIKLGAGAFEYADSSLKKNKKFVLDVIKLNAGAFKYADSGLKKDKEFVLDVIKLNADAFEYADSGLKKDKEFVLKAIRENNLTYFHNREFVFDKEIVLTAIECGIDIDFKHLSLVASDRNIIFNLTNDKEIMLAAIKVESTNFFLCSSDLQKDRDIILTFVNNCSKRYYNKIEEIIDKVPNLTNDKEFMLAAIKVKSTNFFLCSSDLQRDRDIILTFVNNCPMLFDYNSYLMIKESLLVEIIDKVPNLTNDKEFMLAAIKVESTNFFRCSSDLQRDRDIILTFVNNCSMRYYDKIKEIIDKDPKLKKDRDFIIKVLETNYMAYSRFKEVGFRVDPLVKLHYFSHKLFVKLDKKFKLYPNKFKLINYKSKNVIK